MNTHRIVDSPLFQEWDFTANTLDPNVVTVGSNKKAWWVCSKGHRWYANIASRNSGVGCPFCSNRRVTSENNLEARFPELAKEWDTERNQTPAHSVMPGTVKLYWWKCQAGHSYQTSPNKRTSRGQGCPYCSRRRTSDLNRLALAYPQLRDEFHPTKNATEVFDDLSVKSHKKIWWICKRGHEWSAPVSNRTSGRGCPFCNSQVSQNELRIYAELKNIFEGVRLKAKISKQECDILVEPHRVAIEYDGSYWHKDKLAKDKKKNEILDMAGVTLVRLRESGLDKISTDDILVDPTKPTVLQDAIKFIVTLIASRSTLTAQESKRVSGYLEANGFLHDEEYRGLLERLPSPIFEESLLARFPTIATEWHPEKNKKLTPEDVSAFSSIQVWWRCNSGHEWKSSISNRTSGGNNCPYCAHQLISYENSLAAKRPDLVAEWDEKKNGAAADEVFAYSKNLCWWRCANGHEWQAIVSNRAGTGPKKNTGCPYCTNKRANAENCLSTTHPKLAAEWHPDKNGDLTPGMVTQGSYKKVWWRCQKGHDWYALISSRSKGNSCPYCSNQAACKDNALSILFPKLASEWHPEKNSKTPDNVVSGYSKKVWWRCSKGHEWEASPSQRSRLGSGCPYCSGLRATAETCLEAKNPELATQWHPEKNGSLTAQDVTANSKRIVWWYCANGHEWQAPVGARSAGRYRCPLCKSMSG